MNHIPTHPHNAILLVQLPGPLHELPSISIATPVQPVVGPGPAAEGPALCPPALQQDVIAAGAHAVSEMVRTHMPHMMMQILDRITQGRYESPGLRGEGAGSAAGSLSVQCTTCLCISDLIVAACVMGLIRLRRLVPWWPYVIGQPALRHDYHE